MANRGPCFRRLLRDPTEPSGHSGISSTPYPWANMLRLSTHGTRKPNGQEEPHAWVSQFHVKGPRDTRAKNCPAGQPLGQQSCCVAVWSAGTV